MEPNAHLSTSIHDDLKRMLPRLRMYALSLTRDRERADDLVQDTVIKTLAGQTSFRLNTNFAAWVFRILRNEFIFGLRRQRPVVQIDETTGDAVSTPPQQDSGLIMCEFMAAFWKLIDRQREALVLTVLDGQSYEQIASHGGVAVSTIKSRVSRARDTLERLLFGGEDAELVPRFALSNGTTDTKRGASTRNPSQTRASPIVRWASERDYR